MQYTTILATQVILEVLKYWKFKYR